MCEECKVMFLSACGMNEEQVVQFMCDHGVLLPTIICHNCGNELKVCPHSLKYNCGRWVTERKQKRKKCGSKMSAKPGSFLDGSHLTIMDVWKLCVILLHLKPPRQVFIKEEMNLADRTIVDWYSFCREVSIFYYLIFNNFF
jgi:hypothetical protein